jgi:hypothetical protein
MTFDVASAAKPSATEFESAAAWCTDADTRDNVRARRNVLAGLWAGQLMQIPSHLIQSYATAAHHADFGAPGDEDVVDKLLGDLHRCGIAITREEVRQKLCELYRQAIMQTCETD